MTEQILRVEPVYNNLLSSSYTFNEGAILPINLLNQSFFTYPDHSYFTGRKRESKHSKYAYLNQDNSSFTKIIINILQEAENLKMAAKPFLERDGSEIFSARQLLSSHPELVQGKATPNSSIGEYHLKICRLATAQKNVSASLPKADNNYLPQGSHSFSLQVGENEYRLLINIADQDNNESVFQRVSQVINESQDQVAAEVWQDNLEGTVRLEITARQTGVDHKFHLADEGNGNLIRQIGINNQDIPAQDGVFLLNGVESSTQSNHLNLAQEKIQLELLQASEEELVVVVEPNQELVEEKISQFLNQYNRMVNSFGQKGNLLGENILKSLVYCFFKEKESLTSLGISLQSDYTLAMDREKLLDALEEYQEQLKNVFSKKVVSIIYQWAESLAFTPLGQYLFPQNLNPSNYLVIAYLKSRKEYLLYAQLFFQGAFISGLV